MKSVFTYSVSLDQSYRDAIERLFFFNPQQNRYYDQIVRIVEAFGQPVIQIQDDKIILIIANRPEIANLFVLEGTTLAGVVLYAQFKPDILSVLHMAIDPDYTFHGKKRNLYLLDEIFREIKRLARCRHTVEKITLGYTKGENRTIAIPLE